MYITREADYAVRCVLYLAEEPERIASAKKIAESMDIPKTFLAKILQRLSRKGIVTSTRGIMGGFRLAKEPSQINLLEVIEGIQGPSAMNVCAINRRICGRSGTCTVHPIWVELRRYVENTLKQQSFSKLIRKK